MVQDGIYLNYLQHQHFHKLYGNCWKFTKDDILTIRSCFNYSVLQGTTIYDFVFTTFSNNSHDIRISKKIKKIKSYHAHKFAHRLIQHNKGNINTMICMTMMMTKCTTHKRKTKTNLVFVCTMYFNTLRQRHLIMTTT